MDYELSESSDSSDEEEMAQVKIRDIDIACQKMMQRNMPNLVGTSIVCQSFAARMRHSATNSAD